MLFKSVAIAALLAATAQATPEPRAMMPLNEALGLGARSDTGTYQPSQTLCGMGSTCAEACGAGFEMCPSSDKKIHCFNAGSGSSCCSDMSGNSCDAGFYCAGDSSGNTLCCPEGMSLAACAQANSATGALSSETPMPTSTSTSSTSTSSTSSTTKTTSTVQLTSSAANSTTWSGFPQGSVGTISAAVNITSSTAFLATPTPTVAAATTSSTPKSAGIANSPTHAIQFVLAAAFAAFLM